MREEILRTRRQSVYHEGEYYIGVIIRPDQWRAGQQLIQSKKALFWKCISNNQTMLVFEQGLNEDNE